MKIMSVLTIITLLSGCGKNDPFILDGPGMEYVDSEYRTEYANCLPFDDLQTNPSFAVAYLGEGIEGEKNIEVFTEKIFKNLEDEQLEKIKIHKYEGDYWFLVIPRYRETVELKKDDKIICQIACNGEAFVIKCNQDMIVSTFKAEEIDYALSVDEGNKLKVTDSNVWDITNIDEIIKQN